MFKVEFKSLDDLKNEISELKLNYDVITHYDNLQKRVANCLDGDNNFLVVSSVVSGTLPLSYYFKDGNSSGIGRVKKTELFKNIDIDYLKYISMVIDKKNDKLYIVCTNNKKQYDVSEFEVHKLSNVSISLTETEMKKDLLNKSDFDFIDTTIITAELNDLDAYKEVWFVKDFYSNFLFIKKHINKYKNKIILSYGSPNSLLYFCHNAENIKNTFLFSVDKFEECTHTETDMVEWVSSHGTYRNYNGKKANEYIFWYGDSTIGAGVSKFGNTKVMVLDICLDNELEYQLIGEMFSYSYNYQNAWMYPLKGRVSVKPTLFNGVLSAVYLTDRVIDRLSEYVGNNTYNVEALNILKSKTLVDKFNVVHPTENYYKYMMSFHKYSFTKKNKNSEINIKRILYNDDGSIKDKLDINLKANTYEFIPVDGNIFIGNYVDNVVFFVKYNGEKTGFEFSESMIVDEATMHLSVSINNTYPLNYDTWFNKLIDMGKTFNINGGLVNLPCDIDVSNTNKTIGFFLKDIMTNGEIKIVVNSNKYILVSIEKFKLHFKVVDNNNEAMDLFSIDKTANITAWIDTYYLYNVPFFIDIINNTIMISVSDVFEREILIEDKINTLSIIDKENNILNKTIIIYRDVLSVEEKGIMSMQPVSPECDLSDKIFSAVEKNLLSDTNIDKLQTIENDSDFIIRNKENISQDTLEYIKTNIDNMF